MADVSFSTRSEEHDGGQHVTVTVWAGPTGRTRAYVGVLVMRPDEAREFVERLLRGEDQP
jgi:hypothetical protein